MSEALAQFPLPWLIVLALALFLFAFVGLFIHTFRKTEKPKQDYLAHLPLEEEN